ncbi:MAG: hypothetical protein HUJ25_15960 [Crocinitomicaceae bacterium]|nr:hypothetical protein [Crocinitomicaceae bacterium]
MVLNVHKQFTLNNYQKAALLFGAVIILGLIRSLIISGMYGNVGLSNEAISIYIALTFLAVFVWKEYKWAKIITLTLFIPAAAIFAFTILVTPVDPGIIFIIGIAQIYLEIKTAKLLLAEKEENH